MPAPDRADFRPPGWFEGTSRTKTLNVNALLEASCQEQDQRDNAPGRERASQERDRRERAVHE